jgi:hypothetical protein
VALARSAQYNGYFTQRVRACVVSL